MTTYAVIIAARMSSQRLPGKALVSYCPDGTPNLEQIVTRWRTHSRRNPTVVVATSGAREDTPIADLCERIGVPCYRGSLDDVADRMNGAILRFAPTALFIARALADNPLADVPLADSRLDILQGSGCDGIWFGEEHDDITYCGTTDIWSRRAWDEVAACSVA